MKECGDIQQRRFPETSASLGQSLGMLSCIRA